MSIKLPTYSRFINIEPRDGLSLADSVRRQELQSESMESSAVNEQKVPKQFVCSGELISVSRWVPKVAWKSSPGQEIFNCRTLNCARGNPSQNKSESEKISGVADDPSKLLLNRPVPSSAQKFQGAAGNEIYGLTGKERKSLPSKPNDRHVYSAGKQKPQAGGNEICGQTLNCAHGNPSENKSEGEKISVVADKNDPSKLLNQRQVSSLAEKQKFRDAGGNEICGITGEERKSPPSKHNLVHRVSSAGKQKPQEAGGTEICGLTGEERKSPLSRPNHVHRVSSAGKQKPQEAGGTEICGLTGEERKSPLSKPNHVHRVYLAGKQKPQEARGNEISGLTGKEKKNSPNKPNHVYGVSAGKQKPQGQGTSSGRQTFVFKGKKIPQVNQEISPLKKLPESKHKKSCANSTDKTFKSDAVNPFPTRNNLPRQNLNCSSRRNLVMYGPVEPFYEFAGDKNKRGSNDRKNTSKPSAPLRNSTPKPLIKNYKPGPRRNSKPPKTISQPISSQKRITEQVTPLMIENFKIVLSRFPDGITVIDFFDEYEKLFNVAINYYKMGFSSMTAMISKHPEIFKMVFLRGTPYFLVYDAQAPTKTYEEDSLFIPSYIQRRITEIVYDHYDPIEVEKLIEEYWQRYSEKLDAKLFGFKHIAQILCECPKINFDITEGNVTVYKSKKDYYGRSRGFTKEQIHNCIEKHFQPDFLNIHYVYKRPIIHEKSNQAIIVENGGNQGSYFFIHFMEVKSEFDKLMSEIQTFYVENESYVINKEALVPNLAVAAKFSENMRWHRAIILLADYDFYIENPECCKLLFVDYGTVLTVHEADIRPLSKRFGEHPIFAVPSKLYGITYKDDPECTLEISNTLCELIDQDVYIKIAKVGSISLQDKSMYPFLDLVVVDPTTNECINEKMVETNLAIFEQEDEIAGWKVEIRCELIEQETLDKVLQCYVYH